MPGSGRSNASGRESFRLRNSCRREIPQSSSAETVTGSTAVGVASDEVRRFGLNPAKRARLIRAGAAAIVPDFSQADALPRLLRLP